MIGNQYFEFEERDSTLHYEMRFPRFHYGIAIALGLSMLCMSSVPVFADGPSAPTVTGSVNKATVTLSWNVPGGTSSFLGRRDTSAAPANTSAGTLLASPSASVTTYEDLNLPNGTYYYSVFAIGGITSGPGSVGPFTISFARGSKRSARLLRQQMLLNPTWSDTEPPALTDVGIFQSSDTAILKPAAPTPPVKKVILKAPRRIRSKVRMHAKPFTSPRTPSSASQGQTSSSS